MLIKAVRQEIAGSLFLCMELVMRVRLAVGLGGAYPDFNILNAVKRRKPYSKFSLKNISKGISIFGVGVSSRTSFLYS